MAARLKSLAALCGLTMALEFFFYYYFLFNPDLVQDLWDYVIDPIVLGVLVIIIFANLHVTMKARCKDPSAKTLHLDILTMAAVATGSLYLHQYAAKFADAFQPNALLWDLLVPAVVVILGTAAVIYWRKAMEVAGSER